MPWCTYHILAMPRWTHRLLAMAKSTYHPLAMPRCTYHLLAMPKCTYHLLAMRRWTYHQVMPRWICLPMTRSQCRDELTTSWQCRDEFIHIISCKKNKMSLRSSLYLLDHIQMNSTRLWDSCKDAGIRVTQKCHQIKVSYWFDSMCSICARCTL